MLLSHKPSVREKVKIIVSKSRGVCYRGKKSALRYKITHFYRVIKSIHITSGCYLKFSDKVSQPQLVEVTLSHEHFLK